MSKSFGGLTAVDDVTVSVPAGRIVAFIGPNGAGKTTLMNLLTGFVAPDTGSIRWREADITGWAPYRIARSGIGRTFQDLRLFGRLTALDNVLASFARQSGESLRGLFFQWRRVRTQEHENRRRAAELLRFVGLEMHAGSLARNLSYGQQKRLAIARLLALDSSLLILDEPAAGLDPAAVQEIAVLLRELRREGRTICLVEHNLEMVLDVADSVVGMAEGRVIVEGAPSTVLNDKALLEAYMGV